MPAVTGFTVDCLDLTLVKTLSYMAAGCLSEGSRQVKLIVQQKKHYSCCNPSCLFR